MANQTDHPAVFARADHPVSRKDISKNALKVLYRLHNSGFEAYLVGGGVRDILLGRTPKDFDIVTNARPEQVRELFRNSRLIGRRFKLVHVVFGRDVIEVATFRGHHSSVDSGREATQNASGRILRDNVYGNIEEDAERRDFTMNAIYYNIADCSLLDFAGGVADIKRRKLALIGDPHVRYREDPVRMLRAVRFSAKLDLKLDKQTTRVFKELGGLLADIPPARLFDESLKLLLAGSAMTTWRLLEQFELTQYLFPTVQGLAADSLSFAFIKAGLEATDARIAQNKPANPSFLFAMLLWPALEEAAQDYQEEYGHFEAYNFAIRDVLNAQNKAIAIPKRIVADIRDIWTMQLRMEKTTRQQAHKLPEVPKFRAGYDLLALRAGIYPNLQKQVQFWLPVYERTPKQYTESRPPKKRRPFKKYKPRSQAEQIKSK